jgi:hypothetical protein
LKGDQVSDDKAILAVIVGIISIVVGLTVKQFYASNMYGSAGPPIPRWQGRVLFVGVGIVFLAVGISHFFSNH